MTERLTRQEGHALVTRKPKRKSKYGNRKTVLDGITFDSRKEADYYAALKQREKAGEVDTVELQKPFVLSFNGCLVCTYKADCVFYDLHQKRTRVVDTKGYITPEFRLKAKMMRALLGIEVEIIK